MKIGIVGYGYVGSAIGSSFLDHDVIIHDPKIPISVPKSSMLGCDGIFICVPSPETNNGHCDSSILENTLKDLLLVNIKNPIPLICKTTAPPSVYGRLHQEHPNLVYCPEFLTARNHIQDYINTETFILGGTIEYCELARDIISKSTVANKQFLMTDVKGASLFKYMMNSYLATKVSFMNDYKMLADAENIDWSTIKELSKYDHRIGNSHMDVPGPDGEYGWGGVCFPKDTSAIIAEAKALEVDLELLSFVKTLNSKHRRQ